MDITCTNLSTWRIIPFSKMLRNWGFQATYKWDHLRDLVNRVFLTTKWKILHLAVNHRYGKSTMSKDLFRDLQGFTGNFHMQDVAWDVDMIYGYLWYRFMIRETCSHISKGFQGHFSEKQTQLADCKATNLWDLVWDVSIAHREKSGVSPRRSAENGGAKYGNAGCHCPVDLGYA